MLPNKDIAQLNDALPTTPDSDSPEARLVTKEVVLLKSATSRLQQAHKGQNTNWPGQAGMLTDLNMTYFTYLHITTADMPNLQNCGIQVIL